MSKAGIDTSIFKAHSTRSASSSKAKIQGISTAQIANWARAATFQRFYNRSISVNGQKKFQNVVLNL